MMKPSVKALNLSGHIGTQRARNAVDIGNIYETADVFTVQTQTHLLANLLSAHAFGSLQKWHLDQA